MSHSSPFGTFSRRTFLKTAGAFGSGAFFLPLASLLPVAQQPALILNGTPDRVQRWGNWLRSERFAVVPSEAISAASFAPVAAIGLESGVRETLDLVHSGSVQAAVIFEDITTPVDLLPDFARLRTSAARVLVLSDSAAPDSQAKALRFLKSLVV